MSNKTPRGTPTPAPIATSLLFFSSLLDVVFKFGVVVEFDVEFEAVTLEVKLASAALSVINSASSSVKGEPA